MAMGAGRRRTSPTRRVNWVTSERSLLLIHPTPRASFSRTYDDSSEEPSPISIGGIITGFCIGFTFVLDAVFMWKTPGDFIMYDRKPHVQGRSSEEVRLGLGAPFYVKVVKVGRRARRVRLPRR